MCKSTAFIAAYGAYTPAGRVGNDVLKCLYKKGLSGVKSLSVAELDEDSLTMGYEAAKGIVRGGQRPVDALILASNTLPFACKKGSSLLGKMLRLDGTTRYYDMGAGFLAAAEALWMAFQLVEGGSLESVLVVASEHSLYRPGEELDMAWGAGAAAFLVAREGFARLESVRSDYEVESYDFWALRGESIARYRPEMLDDNFDKAIGRLVEKLGGRESLSCYRYIPIQMMRSRWGKALGKKGIKPEQVEPVNCLPHVGNLGTAAFGVNLALAFEQSAAGDRILAVGYSQGNTLGLDLVIEGKHEDSNLKEMIAGGVQMDLADYWQTVFQRRFGK